MAERCSYREHCSYKLLLQYEKCSSRCTSPCHTSSQGADRFGSSSSSPWFSIHLPIFLQCWDLSNNAVKCSLVRHWFPLTIGAASELWEPSLYSWAYCSYVIVRSETLFLPPCNHIQRAENRGIRSSNVIFHKLLTMSHLWLMAPDPTAPQNVTHSLLEITDVYWWRHASGDILVCITLSHPQPFFVYNWIEWHWIELYWMSTKWVLFHPQMCSFKVRMLATVTKGLNDRGSVCPNLACSKLWAKITLL